MAEIKHHSLTSTQLIDTSVSTKDFFLSKITLNSSNVYIVPRGSYYTYNYFAKRVNLYFMQKAEHFVPEYVIIHDYRSVS